MKVTLPTSWDEITLSQFERISDLSTKEFDNDMDRFYAILSIIVNQDKKIIDILVDEHSEDLNESLGFLNYELPTKELDKIIINNKRYGWNKDYHLLTLGEMIAFEMVVTKEELTHNQTIGAYLAIFLRRVKGDNTLEELNEDEIYNIWDSISEMSCVNSISIAMPFLKWRQEILNNYSGLFNSNGGGDEGDGGPKLDKRWVWYSILERLANSDITKFEEVQKQNYLSCLNILSYWKEKDMVTQRLEKRRLMEQKAKSRR